MGQHTLSAEGKVKLAELFTSTAAYYNAAVGESFTATPTAAQTLYDKIVVDGNPFLSLINILPVSQMTGDKIGLDVTDLPGSRTDTENNDRVPVELASLSSKTYECKFTEFDVAMKWSTIDAWSKFPDFFNRYMAAVRRARGNSMLRTGWLGTHAAATTNRTNYPLGQDINKGWLQTLIDFNSGSQYLQGTTNNPVVLGSEDFRNLDVLVHEARQMLAQQFRDRTDLVALIGSDIMAQQDATYYELNSNTPTEKAVMGGQITKAYASLPSMSPAFFPSNGLLVTPLSNLSIYYLESGERREQTNNPKRSRVEEYASSNQAYPVEEELAAAYVANITTG